MASNQVLGLLQITFAGVNFDPLEGSGMVKLGGQHVADGFMSDGGRFYGSKKIAGGEVEFEAAVPAGFDPLAYQNLEGNLTIIADTGQAYLFTNAMMGSTVELKSGEGKAKFTIKGDPAISI
jgi:hypothetical protein